MCTLCLEIVFQKARWKVGSQIMKGFHTRKKFNRLISVKKVYVSFFRDP